MHNYDHQISVIAQNFVLVTASASAQLTPSFCYTTCMNRCICLQQTVVISSINTKGNLQAGTHC